MQSLQSTLRNHCFTFFFVPGIDRILSHTNPGSANPFMMSAFRYSRTDPPAHDLPGGMIPGVFYSNFET